MGAVDPPPFLVYKAVISIVYNSPKGMNIKGGEVVMQNYQYTGLENREVFWNAQNFQIPLDLLALITIAILGYGLYLRFQMWKAMGKSEVRDDNRGERIKNLLRNGVVQLSVWRDTYPGIIHGLIFFAFFVLIWGAAFDAFQFYSGIHFNGKPYLIFSLGHGAIRSGCHCRRIAGDRPQVRRGNLSGFLIKAFRTPNRMMP